MASLLLKMPKVVMGSRIIQPGTVLLDRYEIIEVLGQGAFGIVYKALQWNTNQFVAIKMLHDEQLTGMATKREGVMRRFEREMHIIASITHPHIVQLKDSGELQGQRIMVLEFIEGHELTAFIKQHGRLSFALTKRVICQVLEGLAIAHQRGVVHRDLKPENIMLTGPTARPIAKILDFGISSINAQAVSGQWQSLSVAGGLRGTPSFMAPEQVMDASQATPRSDLYAMGLIILECLTGERAMVGTTPIEVCFKQVNEDVPIPKAIAQSPLGPVLKQVLAKEPEERPASANDLLNALEMIDASEMRDLDKQALGDLETMSISSSLAPELLQTLREAPLPRESITRVGAVGASGQLSAPLAEIGDVASEFDGGEDGDDAKTIRDVDLDHGALEEAIRMASVDSPALASNADLYASDVSKVQSIASEDLEFLDESTRTSSPGRLRQVARRPDVSNVATQGIEPVQVNQASATLGGASATARGGGKLWAAVAVAVVLVIVVMVWVL